MAKANLAVATKQMEKMAGAKTSKRPAGRAKITEDNSTMLNTRVYKALMKRLKRYCVEKETTIQDFVNEVLDKKLKSAGF